MPATTTLPPVSNPPETGGSVVVAGGEDGCCVGAGGVESDEGSVEEVLGLRGGIGGIEDVASDD